jgi:hypothetical protein
MEIEEKLQQLRKEWKEATTWKRQIISRQARALIIARDMKIKTGQNPIMLKNSHKDTP